MNQAKKYQQGKHEHFDLKCPKNSPRNIKTKEQTLNINLKTITAKTPSTKPTLIQTKHYHNNLNKTFSKIIKKKQSNI